MKNLTLLSVILGIHHLAAQLTCPKNCTCQNSIKSTKAIRTNVEEATCSTLPQSPIPQSIVSVKIQTDELNLSHQTLYQVQNVSSLDISSCNLSQIDENVFVSMNNLSVLRLSQNKLSSLPQDLFKTLLFLKELYLDNNELEVVNNEFIYLIRLEILSLSHNKLVSFPDKLPPSLIYLNISYNYIKPTVPANLSLTKRDVLRFRGEILDLYENKIEHILSWNWINMTNLKLLRLGNKVTTISSIKENSIDLKMLTLSANGYSEAILLDGVTQITLKKMSKLTSLTLENYILTDLKFLQPMTELNMLALNYVDTRGGLFNITEGFAHLTNIHHLDLKGSARLAGLILDQIKDLPIDNSLNFLGLQNTELKELHLNQMPRVFAINSQFHLDLRDNFLLCDITLCWMYQLPVRETNLVHPEYTFCEEDSETGTNVRHLLEAHGKDYCLSSQFGTSAPTSVIEITVKTTSYPSGHNAPPKTIHNVEIVVITIIILLAIVIICLIIMYCYFRKLKVNVFLPMNDPNPSIRLQEIDHSDENINQVIVKT